MTVGPPRVVNALAPTEDDDTGRFRLEGFPRLDPSGNAALIA